MMFAELSPILQYVAAIITAVWAVFEIKSTTKTLGIDIKYLGSAILELKDSQNALARDFIESKEKITHEVSGLSDRLIRLETNCKFYHSQDRA